MKKSIHFLHELSSSGFSITATEDGLKSGDDRGGIEKQVCEDQQSRLGPGPLSHTSEEIMVLGYLHQESVSQGPGAPRIYSPVTFLQ